MRQLRPTGVKRLAQGHSVYKQESWEVGSHPSELKLISVIESLPITPVYNEFLDKQLY